VTPAVTHALTPAVTQAVTPAVTQAVTPAVTQAVTPAVVTPAVTRDLTGERGAGSVLAVAIVASIVGVTSMFIPLYTGLQLRHVLSGTADAAALAAADVAVGISRGFPCEVAAEFAAANGATLSSCTVDGLVVTVSVSRPFFGILVTAFATAGPPTGEPD